MASLFLALLIIHPGKSSRTYPNLLFQFSSDRLQALEPSIVRSDKTQSHQVFVLQEFSGDGVHRVQHILRFHFSVELQPHSVAQGIWVQKSSASLKVWQG